MSRQADCPSCLTGTHDDHDPKWNIREGLIGGNYCGCTGDCAERAKAAFDSVWDAIVGPSNSSSSSPGEVRK